MLTVQKKPLKKHNTSSDRLCRMNIWRLFFKYVCNWMCFLVYMLQSLCLTTFPFSALGPLRVILSTLPLPDLFCCAEMTQATFITISASTFGVVHAWRAFALVVKLPLHKNRQRHLVRTWLVMDLPWLVWSICRHSVNLWHDLLARAIFIWNIDSFGAMGMRP